MFVLKRSLAEIGRVSSQQRDMFSLLLREDSEYIRAKGVRYYMRDVHDHLMRIGEEVNTDRETLEGVVNLYLSSFSNRLNMTVSRLTVLTILFGAFAVLTGFYGMNFEQTWPPFSAPWGVPFVLGLMGIVLTVVLLLFYPRRTR
jgi:magnesium transporter